MKKITKKSRKEFLKNKLGTNRTWAINAMLKIYEYQTSEEQNIESTTEHNGVGFTGFDGEILSSFVGQWQRRKSLSEKQLIIVFKKMPKYWNQILNISDLDKLDSLIVKE